MGCAASSVVSPELLTNLESKRLTTGLMEVSEKWKLQVCEFSDCLETFHLTIAHWINDEEQDPKSIYVATFKDLSTLSTELFIGARPFSQSLNLFKGFLAEDIIPRLREIYDSQRILAKTRANLAAFRAKHAKIAPTTGGENVDEIAGNGQVANLLKIERQCLNCIKEYQESLSFDMTVSLILHLHEITSQYYIMWETYQKIFKSMIDLLNNIDFLTSEKEHESRKLKKVQISNRIAQQDSKRKNIANIVSFSKKSQESWRTLVTVQANAVFALCHWTSTIEKGLNANSVNESQRKSLVTLKSFLEDWLRITDPRSSSKGGGALPRLSLTKESSNTFNQTELRLKEQASFFLQIQNRNDDIKLTIKESFDIMPFKGSQGIFYEKAQQKISAVIEDNRKFAISQLPLIERAVFLALIETALKLSLDFKIPRNRRKITTLQTNMPIGPVER